MASVTNTFKDTINYTYTGNGSSVSAPLGTYTGAKDAGIATVVAAGAVNTAIAITFPFATIQSFIMATDQDLTIKVNSSSTPTETFVIKRTAPHIWATDFVYANPWAHDVTTLYISNPGAVDAKFNLRVLFN